MPADTPVAGTPAHAVATYTPDENMFGVCWLDWTAQCGATGRSMTGRFLRAGSCRRLELCPKCFPGQDHNACRLAPPVKTQPAPTGNGAG
jgi:hypothetical protein